jgi:ribosomal protein S18 acetylase RimI-like enzyme
MPVPDHATRFWRALDANFGRVQPTWWGAVVTDDRYPAIWDANYARIDDTGEDLRAADIEGELLPALAAVGTDVMHVVSFDPDTCGPLLAELSTRGHHLTFDLVMDLDDPSAGAATGAAVEELPPGDELWDRVAASMALFGVETRTAVEQLRDLERDVMAPAGKRWFGVRDAGGTLVSLGALLLLDGVGYLDNVATFPEARGQGLASAITTRIVREADVAGAGHVWLLADPDAATTVAMYERLGFRDVGRLAATRGPVPASRRPD